MVDIPCFLHQRGIDGARSNGVDSNLAVAVFFCRSLCQTDYAVFAGVISTVLSESCTPWLEKESTSSCGMRHALDAMNGCHVDDRSPIDYSVKLRS
jgi:hypothetical protein